MATNTIDLVLLSALEKLQIEQNIINRFNGLKPIVVDNYEALNSVVDKNNGFYVTLDTNRWYVYQGGAWVDGGVYQERGIGNGEIVKVNLSQELLDYIASREWVSGNFATEREAHSLRKEILNLKEEIFGTILDTTTIDIEDGGVIPSIVNVDGKDYNVVPHGDVSLLSVEGNTIKSYNLLPTLPITTFDTTNNTTGSSFTIELWTKNDGSGTKICADLFLSNGTTIENRDIIYDGFVYVRYGLNGSHQDNKHWLDKPIYVTSGTYHAQYNYLEWSLNHIRVSNVMLVKGTDTLPYQPYFEGLKATEYRSINVSSQNLLNVTQTSFTTTANTEDRKDCFIIQFYREKDVAIDNYLFAMTDESVKSVDYNGLVYVRYGLNGNVEDNKVWMDEPVYLKSGTYYFSYDYIVNEANNVEVANVMLVKGGVKPSEFIPYYNNKTAIVSATLQGIAEGNHHDNLEIRLNPITELYDVYKIENCSTITYDGSDDEHWYVYLNNIWSNSLDALATDESEVLTNSDYYAFIHSGSTKFKIFTEGNHSVESWKEYLKVKPLVVTYVKANPTETKIATGLTFEDVTALAHTSSNFYIGNDNARYLNNAKAKLGIVYKKTGSTNLISGGAL